VVIGHGGVLSKSAADIAAVPRHGKEHIKKYACLYLIDRAGSPNLENSKNNRGLFFRNNLI
jgi:hypothetical protein